LLAWVGICGRGQQKHNSVLFLSLFFEAGLFFSQKCPHNNSMLSLMLSEVGEGRSFIDYSPASVQTLPWLPLLKASSTLARRSATIEKSTPLLHRCSQAAQTEDSDLCDPVLINKGVTVSKQHHPVHSNSTATPFAPHHLSSSANVPEDPPGSDF
jgi:hypothetical protein